VFVLRKYLKIIIILCSIKANHVSRVVESNKNIVKLAKLYSIVVSKVFDINDTGRTIDAICQKINSHLNEFSYV